MATDKTVYDGPDDKVKTQGPCGLCGVHIEIDDRDTTTYVPHGVKDEYLVHEWCSEHQNDVIQDNIYRLKKGKAGRRLDDNPHKGNSKMFEAEPVLTENIGECFACRKPMMTSGNIVEQGAITMHKTCRDSLSSLLDQSGPRASG